MRWMILLAVCVGCEYERPVEFRYKQRVEVVEGFYKGQVGEVEKGTLGRQSFYVRFDNDLGKVHCVDSADMRAQPPTAEGRDGE